MKWYLKPASVILALLIAGPLAIPLVWMSPAFKKRHKAFITALVILITVWLIKTSVVLYETALRQLGELQSTF